MANSSYNIVPHDGTKINGSLTYQNYPLKVFRVIHGSSVELNCGNYTINGKGVRKDPYARYDTNELAFLSKNLLSNFNITSDTSFILIESDTNDKEISFSIVSDAGNGLNFVSVNNLTNFNIVSDTNNRLVFESPIEVTFNIT